MCRADAVVLSVGATGRTFFDVYANGIRAAMISDTNSAINTGPDSTRRRQLTPRSDIRFGSIRCEALNIEPALAFTPKLEQLVDSKEITAARTFL